MQIENVAIGAILLWRDVSTVGTHAFAKHFFARGCNVAWYTVPLSPLHLLSVAGLYNGEHADAQRRRFDWWREGAHLQEHAGARMAARVALTAVHPARKLPLLSSPFVSRHYLKWRVPSLPSRSLRDGIGPIDTSFFDAGGLELFFAFRRTAKLNIYRVNDMAGEYASQVEGRVTTEKEIIRQSDLLFAVSQSIYDQVVKIRGTQENVHLLPNGFDGDLFATQQPLPPEYEQIPAPRAVLVAGNLSSCYDWDLIINLARLRPHLSICIIGYCGIPEGLPDNIHLLGIKPHDQVPGYLQHASVGLIPFLDMERIRRVERPLKFYEYMAAGLPIVSVPYGSMSIMAPYVTFATSAPEFAEAVDQATLATAQDRALRRQAADQFSWRAMMADFERMLGSEGISLPPAQSRDHA